MAAPLNGYIDHLYRSFEGLALSEVQELRTGYSIIIYCTTSYEIGKNGRK